MKKKGLLLSLAALFILVISLFSYGKVEASGIPYVEAEEENIIASVGSTVNINYTYYPSFVDEEVTVNIYSPKGALLGTVTKQFSNGFDTPRGYTVTWDTVGNPEGQYKVEAKVRYFSRLLWHDGKTTLSTIILTNKPFGWKKVSGYWHYYDANGNSLTGWQKIGNVSYYFNSAGVMQTGWQKIGKSWFYLETNGAMQTGWKKIHNVWFYFDVNGIMQTGWKQIVGKWYYFKSSGQMAANEWIGGYWLNKDGSWTYPAKGTWRKDQKGWWFGDGSWYARNQWQMIDGKWYYFDTKGYMVTGEVTIGGKVYRFNASGVCLNR